MDACRPGAEGRQDLVPGACTRAMWHDSMQRYAGDEATGRGLVRAESWAGLHTRALQASAEDNLQWTHRQDACCCLTLELGS